MLEKVLVPVDGSATAEAILRPLAELLAWGDAEVVLLRVADPPGPVSAPTLRHEGLVSVAEECLSKAVDWLRRHGIRAKPIVRTGPPARTILDVAKDERVSLVAMATHGRRGVARWLLGSVAETVLRAVEVPVLMVRAAKARRRAASRRIV